MTTHWNRPGLVLVLGVYAMTTGTAQEPSQTDLSRMDVEDLMNLKVTSVSKREQSLSRTAAAVWVINQDDIRRSGATNIPELLRLAPGVDVEQIDANAWAISVRGFNARYSNKVLVLIDGRTVYTSAFSGVFWEHIDMPLEDIERIEVIRGPGATVWGANAVNGVISIFTKSSKDTKGALATAGAGSRVHGMGVAQYGGPAGDSGAYRVYAKYFSIGNSARLDGSPAADHWMSTHGGFRYDWDLSPGDSLMAEGSLFTNDASQTRRESFIAGPYDHTFDEELDATGGDLLARWNHTLRNGSQTTVQSYIDIYRRTDMGVPEVGKTFDIDFQHHAAVRERHDIVWGLGYRVSTSALAAGHSIGFFPPSRTDSLFSGFVQDEIRASDSLWFTIGCKLEHNAYTGVQTEPSARLAWNRPGSRHTLWAAASKALRQPSRAETAIRTDAQTVPVGPGVVEVLRVKGNPLVRDEEVRDFESGYRTEFTKTLSFATTAFLSIYRHLQTVEPQAMSIIPGSPVQLLIPLVYDNKAYGKTYGGEIALRWSANTRWRITPSYSYLQTALRQDSSSLGRTTFDRSAEFPRNMVRIRSSINLPRAVEFDQSLYYTARLPGSAIPGHTRLDLRLARRMGERTEVSVVGQNLLRPRNLEYGDSWGVVGTQVVRSIYAQVTRRF